MFGVAGLRFNQLPLRGAASQLRYLFWAACWIAGHAAGGAVCGTALGMAGAALPAGAADLGFGVLAIACFAWSLQQFRLLDLPMPQWRRQVTREWMLRLPWDVVALGYGFQLGSGVATRITVATTYAVLGCALFTRSPIEGACMVGLFGVTRSILPVVVGRRVASPACSLAFAASFSRHESLVQRLNGGVLAAASLVLAGTALYH